MAKRLNICKKMLKRNKFALFALEPCWISKVQIRCVIAWAVLDAKSGGIPSDSSSSSPSRTPVITSRLT